MALKRTVCVKARLSSATRHPRLSCLSRTRCQSALLHLLLLLLLRRPKPNHLHRIFSSIESIVDVTGLERSRYQKHVLEMIDVRNFAPTKCGKHSKKLSWPLLNTPIEARLAVIFNSPENKTCCWFLHLRTIDSDMPYSRAISRLLSTASASATIFNLKFRL